MKRRSVRQTACLLAIACAASVAARSDAQVVAQPNGKNEVHAAYLTILDPDSPAGKAYAAEQRKRLEIERQLKKIRAKHFGTIKNVELRQAGIAKLRQFTDPQTYASLVEVTKGEADDVRTAVLDHLWDQKNEAADTAIAWMGVFDRDAGFRERAIAKVRSRMMEAGEAPRPVVRLVQGALRSDNEQAIVAAANMASGLSLYEAIPWLIAAQIQAPTQTGAQLGSGAPAGDLAYIVVGRQVAFVSDLTPVVSDSAVGFDPTLGVVTEGVVLRIGDAVVTTFRTEVHNALVDLSTRDWGRSTMGFGYDTNAWRSWYLNDYRPFVEARRSGTLPQEGAKAEPAASR